MTEPAVPETALDPETAGLLRRGIEELRAGRFFESHDTLEEAWRGARGGSRDFLKGLVQIAVGCYHLQGGNPAGAESQLGKALGNLEDFGSVHLGIPLPELRRCLGAAIEALRSGKETPDAGSLATAVQPPGAR